MNQMLLCDWILEQVRLGLTLASSGLPLYPKGNIFFFMKPFNLLKAFLTKIVQTRLTFVHFCVTLISMVPCLFEV